VGHVDSLRQEVMPAIFQFLYFIAGLQERREKRRSSSRDAWERQTDCVLSDAFQIAANSTLSSTAVLRSRQDVREGFRPRRIEQHQVCILHAPFGGLLRPPWRFRPTEWQFIAAEAMRGRRARTPIREYG
jgi:hypothetical protein